MRKVALGALVTAVLFAVAPPGARADLRFDLKGKWTCKDGSAVKPIAGARLELWRHRTAYPDQQITHRYTADDGSYNIPVRSERDSFNLYTKILLRDDGGTELQNWLSPFTWETTTSKKAARNGVVDLGTWQISRDGSGSPKCAVWQGAHNAFADYVRTIGSKPPAGSYLIEADFPCCGSPFTTVKVTEWPAGFPVAQPVPGEPAYGVSFHEFGHSVRHSFDGGFGHFVADAARYAYPQNHTSCKVTSGGFAFNEGWADYWARRGHDCPATPQDFSQEGNVAAELKRLETCVGRPAMVNVLRRNPGAIHSLAEFQTRFSQLTGVTTCATPRFRTAAVDEVTLSPPQLAADSQAQITAQRKVVADLSRRLRAAKLRARDPGRCTAGRCQAALERLVAPSALEAQLGQAKLVLARLEEGLAAARKAKFDPSAQLRLADGLRAGRDDFEKDLQKVLIDGLGKGLRQIKTEPGFKRARRSEQFKSLDSQRDKLVRARKRGQDTPDGARTELGVSSSPLEDATKTR